MDGLLVAVVVLLTATLIVLIVGIVLYVRRITQAVREIGETLAEVRKHVIPLSEDVRYVLVNTDGLVSSARTTVETVNRVAESVERLVDGKTITDVAGKVVASSRSTVVTVLEGVKEALKAFKSAKPEARQTPEPVDDGEAEDSGA